MGCPGSGSAADLSGSFPKPFCAYHQLQSEMLLEWTMGAENQERQSVDGGI